MKDILSGYAELCGAMIGVKRDGGRVIKWLSKENPVALPASLYSEFWWDEYDVSPIGGVRYKTKTDDAGSVDVLYRFGDGLSVYDMTNNKVIEMMADANQDTINGVIDTFFAPNVGGISFTPVELDAKGLPYLEAGDYLVVDCAATEDGQPLYADTYIMRSTLRGVLSITDEIDSGGGEIIRDGYYMTGV